jgi:hypothetical protein
MHAMTVHRAVAALSLLTLYMLVLPADAAPPQVTKIAVPTLQRGATTTLIIEGTDLVPSPRILLPMPIVSQTVKEGAAANKLQIEVKLAADVAPGVYQMRIANDKGISGPIGIEIDELPQQPFGPQVGPLPVVLQGALGGSATLSTALVGKKGQRLVVEAEARRIGSAIDPVLKLLDPRRVQITGARPSNALAGDARLTMVLPADGTYTLELHDLQYKAGTPNRFRLRIGDLQYADLPFPLAGQRGSKASFQLIGSMPETTRVETDLAAAPGGSFVRLPRAPGVSGLSLYILVSDIPEVVKVEQPPGKLQEVTVPVGINGRLGKPKEEDRYRVTVQPGAKLRFDVLAERAGSALDGVLILRNEAGAQLARSDDQPGTLDPGLEYVVPQGVTALVAAVSDVNGRGGPQYVYRLAITPVGAPDFSLALLDDRPHVPRSGAALVRVRATRTGYAGPIKLTLAGVPEGVVVAGDEIPAGATDTLLSFSAAEETKLSQAVLRVIGEGTDGNVALRRVAILPETPLSRVHPWLRGELAIAVTEPGPIGIAWETPPEKLPIGGNVSTKVKWTRAAETKGTLRLSLVTSQIVPKGKDMKDDMNRALRLETVPTVATDQTTADLKLLVPGDLPPLPYDVAIRAELMAADNKTVAATAVTASRRLMAAK